MLAGSQKFGITPEACLSTAQAIKALSTAGIQVAVVIGGGNIFRGISLATVGMERTPADQMGMLATLINGIALQESLKAIGCPTKIMSALECPRIVEPYKWSTALEYLNNETTLIFVGGTGNPYFTTDTAAAMRASEIGADALLKATKVDGIYNKDPLKYHDAVKYPTITYSQMLAEKLEVMDATAVALCRSSAIPILVFNMATLKDGQILTLLGQQNFGTLVTPG